MTDFVIGAVHLPGRVGLWDVAVTAGVISGIDRAIPADTRHDGAGGLLFGGFVDAHIHLDKAGILHRCDMSNPSLAAAVTETAKAKAAASEEDVYHRAAHVVEAAIMQGTTLMRSFVEVDPRAGLRGLNALLRLRADYAWAVEIQLCAFAQEGLTHEPETLTLLDTALKAGCDLVGGCSYRDPDPVRHIDLILDLAAKYGVDADFHIDFSLDPDATDLPALIAATRTRGYQGRVTAGHVTNLSAMPPDQVDRVGADLAEAGIAVVALPSTDLFLMGRTADQNVPRGVAPLGRLAKQGVRVAVATNNVLNPFTPYGDANALRMANLYANVAQLAADDDLAACFDMVGDGAAAIMGRVQRLEAGAPANLVLLAARDPASAVRTLAPVQAGWRNGRQSFVKPSGQLFPPLS